MIHEPKRGEVEKINMQKILDFIVEYRGKHQISPNLRELSLHIYGHEKGMGNIHPLIERLIDEGFLYKAAKGARSLILTAPQPRPYYFKLGDE